MEENLPENQKSEKEQPSKSKPEPQSPQPIEPTPKQTESLDVRTKEAAAKAKKKRFKKTAIIIGVVLFGLIITPIVLSIYRGNIKNEPVIVQEVEEENRTVQIEDVGIKKMVQADSGSLKLSLEYPEDAYIFEQDINGIKKLDIIYSPSTSEPASITEDSLDQGYIFRASTFNIETRDLKEVSEIKRTSFIAKCPTTAEISNVEKSTVSTSESFTFDVINCNGDYKLNYVSKFGTFYEFMQFYKGDFGYKQRYRAATEDILRSVNLYPEVVIGETTVYENEKYGIKFEYPSSLSTDCCDLTGPILNRSKKLIVAGDSETLVDQNNFDGFGVFIELTGDTTFDEYIKLQRKTLIEDYTVVKGKAPEPEDVAVTVGGKEGIMLKNYSWRGNDLIFVDVKNQGFVLIISVLNISGDSFAETFNTVLRSFEFN